MKITEQIAQHLHEVYFGGNWTGSSLKDQLSDVTWEQATTQVYSLNSIATLVNHMGYYVRGIAKVLEGGPLELEDKYSFTHPPIESAQDWKSMLDEVWANAEHFAGLIEKLPDSKLDEEFEDPQYGNYYRNLQGIVEHFHYHLGQIAVIKRILQRRREGA